ncbi:MAG: SLC13 family permease [bacterium]|nr:SLC13 family permease [bacterium]
MAIAVFTFALAYLLLIDGFYRRTTVVAFAAFFLLLTGVLTPGTAVRAIDWNVIGLFFGMLVLADLFLASRMPAIIAGRIARSARSVGGAILGMCVLASVLSAVLENVAVVLILAPLALALARQLQTPAAPMLIGISLSSNLQGAATLVGDPPSMLLGSYAGLTFNDFFWLDGRPGIFFAVQAGALMSFVLLWVLFRHLRAPAREVPAERPQSLVPSILLVGVIVALVGASFLFPHAPYASAVIVLVGAAIGLLWHAAVNGSAHSVQASATAESAKPLSRLAQRHITFRDRIGDSHRLLRALDWETTGFLMGVFVLVGALAESGAIVAFAEWFVIAADGSTMRMYVALVLFSVALSAFIDNVPFTIAMLPVAGAFAARTGADPMLFFGALLLGASVGGNITPIGASANIVACRWIEERAGEPMSFLRFARYGLPFTLVSVGAATVFWWFAWS